MGPTYQRPNARARAGGCGLGRLGPGGEREPDPKRTRFQAFQSDLAEDSKGEKVEEIPRINSPLLIWPEKERGGRIWKGNGGGAT